MTSHFTRYKVVLLNSLCKAVERAVLAIAEGFSGEVRDIAPGNVGPKSLFENKSRNDSDYARLTNKARMGEWKLFTWTRMNRRVEL